ncbi:MAG: hypothetical protein ACLP8S_08025 [Solirubrobacteraceae bacterium]
MRLPQLSRLSNGIAEPPDFCNGAPRSGDDPTPSRLLVQLMPAASKQLRGSEQPSSLAGEIAACR